MSDALEEHDDKIIIGDKIITSLRFAKDIDALAEEKHELEALTESLDKICTRHFCRLHHPSQTPYVLMYRVFLGTS